jgi:hypothetical protein
LFARSALDLEAYPYSHLELRDLAALDGAANLGNLEPMFRRVFPAPETADLMASATLLEEVPTTSIFLKVAKVQFLSS